MNRHTSRAPSHTGSEVAKNSLSKAPEAFFQIYVPYHVWAQRVQARTQRVLEARSRHGNQSLVAHRCQEDELECRYS